MTVLHCIAEPERDEKGNPQMERSLEVRAESSGADRTADQRVWVFNTHTDTGNKPLQETRAGKGSLTCPGKQTGRACF